jgi:hypothetical protein
MRMGGGVIPALLLALENETLQADSVAVALRTVGVATEEVSTRLIRFANNNTLRRRFAALLARLGQRQHLKLILLSLLRNAPPPLQAALAEDLNLCAGSEGNLTDTITKLASLRPTQAVALLEGLVPDASPGAPHPGLSSLVADALSDEAVETRKLGKWVTTTLCTPS